MYYVLNALAFEKKIKQDLCCFLKNVGSKYSIKINYKIEIKYNIHYTYFHKKLYAILIKLE